MPSFAAPTLLVRAKHPMLESWFPTWGAKHYSHVPPKRHGSVVRFDRGHVFLDVVAQSVEWRLLVDVSEAGRVYMLLQLL